MSNNSNGNGLPPFWPSYLDAPPNDIVKFKALMELHIREDSFQREQERLKQHQKRFTIVMTVRVQGQSVKGSVQGQSVKGS